MYLAQFELLNRFPNNFTDIEVSLFQMIRSLIVSAPQKYNSTKGTVYPSNVWGGCPFECFLFKVIYFIVYSYISPVRQERKVFFVRIKLLSVDDVWSYLTGRTLQYGCFNTID